MVGAMLGAGDKVGAGEVVESPRLLYTQPEQERMQTLLRIAGKEIEV